MEGALKHLGGEDGVRFVILSGVQGVVVFLLVQVEVLEVHSQLVTHDQTVLQILLQSPGATPSLCLSVSHEVCKNGGLRRVQIDSWDPQPLNLRTSKILVILETLAPLQ
jgi:hypothetical protein